uniref:Putative secreted protein n=1 Tax=Anopheles triannulatus TaxID=58253 RepID=A0A2M4B4H5_9DIPT
MAGRFAFRLWRFIPSITARGFLCRRFATRCRGRTTGMSRCRIPDAYIGCRSRSFTSFVARGFIPTMIGRCFLRIAPGRRGRYS